jgi:phage-related tail fiber protein
MKITANSSNQYQNSSVSALSKANLSTDLGNKISTTLASTHLLIGNGSNIATDTVLSGDATLSNNGVLTLKNTGSAGTYTSVTTDAAGRVTAGTNTAASTSTNGYLISTDWNTFNNVLGHLLTGFTTVSSAGTSFTGPAAPWVSIPAQPIPLQLLDHSQHVQLAKL